MSQNVEQAAANRNHKSQQPQPQQQQQREKPQPVEEPGPPSRPALPHRLIVVPDPPQHANRPLPPTPKSAAAPQQPPRNSQNAFKPSVSNSMLFSSNCCVFKTDCSIAYVSFSFRNVFFHAKNKNKTCCRCCTSYINTKQMSSIEHLNLPLKKNSVIFHNIKNPILTPSTHRFSFEIFDLVFSLYFVFRWNE